MTAVVVVVVASSILASLGGPGAATHAAATTTPALETTVGAAVQLPAVAVVGQQAEVTMRVANSSSAGRLEVEVSLTTAVTAVNPDASYTTRSTIGTVDVPVGAELAGPDINNLVTRSFEQSFTAQGMAIPQASTLLDSASMTVEQQQRGRELVDAMSMVSVGFPATPVQVGATWTSPGQVGGYGSVIPVDYHCRLTALDASTYTMDVSYAETFSLATNLGMIEATVAGTGSIVGSVTNPLVVAATLEQTTDGIQGATPLHNDTSIALNGTGV